MKETTNFKQIADEIRRLAIEGIFSAKKGLSAANGMAIVGKFEKKGGIQGLESL